MSGCSFLCFLFSAGSSSSSPSLVAKKKKKQKSNGNRNDRFEEGWQIGDGGCCRRDFPPRLTGRR